MPILYFLKSPRSTLALQGVIDDKLVRQLAKTLGPIVSGTAMDGKKIVIPAQEDCNITYIKEITQKEFDKAQADIKKNQAEDTDEAPEENEGDNVHRTRGDFQSPWGNL